MSADSDGVVKHGNKTRDIAKSIFRHENALLGLVLVAPIAVSPN